jgi:hypothetical protein
MDMLALYTSMAARWQDASLETTNIALRACYARRAQRYLELAERESNRPAHSPPDKGFLRVCGYS